MQIALMRPQLPTADRLMPYFARIDASRHYSNSGPLLAELETRLAKHVGVEAEHVACVANATIGLSLCLMVQAGARAGACVLPSWTFEASAVAARAAGLEPWFHDVGEDSWALRPGDVLQSAACRDGGASAVMPVCPFGAAIPTRDWDDFTAETGIPVVIDAAAAVDALIPGRTPSVLSLHATKLLSTGEGGAVISTDAELIREIRQLANFGFRPVRRIDRAGLNAKMSEYAAAVGLAALDGWPERRQAIAERAQWYVELVSGLPRTSLAPGFGGVRLQPTCNLGLAGPSAASLIDWLEARGIGARKWWGNGCHRQPAFEGSPRQALPVTEALADSVVGLPFYADISRRQVEQVMESVGDFLRLHG